jgi:hypothetical protein
VKIVVINMKGGGENELGMWIVILDDGMDMQFLRCRVRH